jgi:hypothetical protein
VLVDGIDGVGRENEMISPQDNGSVRPVAKSFDISVDLGINIDGAAA